MGDEMLKSSLLLMNLYIFPPHMDILLISPANCKDFCVLRVFSSRAFLAGDAQYLYGNKMVTFESLRAGERDLWLGW